MWEHAINTIPRWKRILQAPALFWCYSGLRDRKKLRPFGWTLTWNHIMIGYYTARIYMGKK